MSNLKSVVFLLGRWTVGGVERVTVTVANELCRRGWHVCVAAFEYCDRDLLGQLDKAVAVEELSMPAYSLCNVRRLRYLFRQHQTKFVVNQWALPFPVTLMIRLAMRKGARTIAFHHTMPSRNNRVATASGRLKRWVWKCLAAMNLRLVYRYNDAYCVLAEAYKKVFSEFTGVKDCAKVFAIPNPVQTSPCEASKKENVILFVGRLSQSEKRLDRVIEVWKRLSTVLADWRLDIVGEGPDRQCVERMAAGLPRVKFYGFQRPDSFYERAKILLLTSDFEGFPMALVEAMSHKCVPVVLKSFMSADDIVYGGNGVLVDLPWDIDRFAAAVLSVATDDLAREEMARKGQESIDFFSVESVGDKYEALFERISA